MVRTNSESDGTHRRRTILKTGLVAATGVAGLSTVSFAQNNENSDYVITLTAVDQDGNPLQGKATVIGSADGNIIGERELDEDGQATWEVNQEGEYSYNVYDVAGYEEASTDTSFEVDGDTDITAEMEKEDQQVDEESTITVTVLDEETGEPIEGATVELVGALPGPAESLNQGETNSDGVYETTVPAVRHEVFVDLVDGYYANDTTADLSEGDADVTVELTPENDAEDGDDSTEDDSHEDDESSGDDDATDDESKSDDPDCEKR